MENIDEVRRVAEVWKLNDERNKSQSVVKSTMSIYSKPGTKVKFTGLNGYEFEKIFARTQFQIGQQLTVNEIGFGLWSNSVEFREYPGKWFNTVLFE